jgi:plasmid stabilization system protein ParE
VTDAAWDVFVTDAAQEDFDKALLWTLARFGTAQEDIYRRALAAGLRSLVLGPAAPGVRQRSFAGRTLFVLRPRMGRRQATHFLVFRLADDTHTVIVLRILHGKMDMPRRLKRLR